MEQYYDILKTMSDESRFRIINLLLNHDLCVGGLAKRLNISKPAVSQHLQALKKVGLVTGEKRGYFTHYSVNRPLLAQVGEKLIALSLKPNDGGCCREKTGDCGCQCQLGQK